MSKRLIEVAVWAVIGMIVAGVVALAGAADYACHRWVGPAIVGTSDPVAVAVYCRRK